MEEKCVGKVPKQSLGKDLEKNILKESLRVFLKISLVESRNDLAKESQKG